MVSQLLAGWNDALRTAPIPNGATMYEVGIPAIDGAYGFPSRVTQGAFSQQIQANWFAAACRFVQSHKLRGIYFWGPDFWFNHGRLMSEPDATVPFQLQPAAQTAIRACF